MRPKNFPAVNGKGDTVLKAPVNAGVVALLAAPVPTTAGAIAAMVSSWSIAVERGDGHDDEGVSS